MINLLQDYISESAKKFPEKPAAVFGGELISYQDFDERSNQMARALQKLGVTRGDRVAFCLFKSIDSLIALAGILKADAVYVPLNPQAPAARAKQIIDDARPAIVICNNKTLPTVAAAGTILNLDDDREFVREFSSAPLDYKNSSGDLAYILYTSGSTGTPKGVMITHANVINATEWAVDEFNITHEDRMSQHPPLHFDLSTFDLYCAFKSAATLYLVPESLSLFPGQLMKFIEDHRLTIWDSVPSVMVYLSNAGLVKPERMASVKKIFFNGEGFPAKFLAEWMKTYPEKEFINMYGPTETTVQCTFYRVPAPPADLSRLVPIGKAQRGAEVFDVDGELYVAGAGVGKGYWNNPEKTAEAFVPDPRPGKAGMVYKTGDLVRRLPDGNYEFIGRKDFQVKVMGNRIELGDIEAALYSLSSIKEAGVIAVEAPETGGVEIAAFVSLKEKGMTPETIKTDLAKLLPHYMIPHIIEIRDILPRTSTGKVDRPKLKDEYTRKH